MKEKFEIKLVKLILKHCIKIKEGWVIKDVFSLANEIDGHYNKRSK